MKPRSRSARWSRAALLLATGRRRRATGRRDQSRSAREVLRASSRRRSWSTSRAATSRRCARELGVAEALLRDGAFVERRGRAVRDREVAALRGVHRLRRVPERRVRPRRRARPRRAATAPRSTRSSRSSRAARARRTGAPPTAAPSTSRSRPAITPACSRGSRPIKTRRSDPAVGRRRARVPARPRRLRRRQARRRRGRARHDLEEEPAVLVGDLPARRDPRAPRRVQGLRRGDVRDRRDARRRQVHVRRRRSLLHDQGPRAPRPRPARARERRVRRRLLPLLPDPRRLGLPARRAVRGVVVDVPEARARDVARPREGVPQASSRRSPLWPEASLLAGYVELADCKFDESQKWYDELVAKLQPIVDEMDKVRKDADLRKQLFATAITRLPRGQADRRARGQEARHGGGRRRRSTRCSPCSASIPKFVRLNDAITGMHELANSAPAVVRQWQNLGTQVSETEGRRGRRPRRRSSRSSSPTRTPLVEDLRRLGAQIARAARRARARAARGHDARRRRRDRGAKRLDDLARARSRPRSRNAVARRRRGRRRGQRRRPRRGIRPLIQADIGEARRLDKAVARARRASSRPPATSSRSARSTSSTTTRAACSTRPSSARSTR